MPHSTYLPHKMGTATVAPRGRFEAGSYQQFTVTYTAGYFGIDDTGSIKIVHRFASDMGRPQFDHPRAPNYTTVEASNGATLHVEYDIKRNIRPWDKTLYIKVVRGFLREGDRITVRFGDRRQGSAGIRIQTFCEKTFEFRVLVDAMATYNYVELPRQPIIEIVAGLPVLYKAILPTSAITGKPFRLCLKGEDRWGNPSHRCRGKWGLRANKCVQGLPDSIQFAEGEFSLIVENLVVREEGVLIIELLDEKENVICRSNPNRMVNHAALLPYWGDLHGQSEETIGTNSARDFFLFARDKAFLDVCSHQGNDFQITRAFWDHLNALSAAFTRNNEFIVFPGWEWSGNTGLGGDRNVLHMKEGRPIHRSSHALVDDLSDIDSDSTSAAQLFEDLQGEDCAIFAHIGGRYADIRMAHDERLERSVEVHSAWGTFEWLIEDAFEQGYRVGIVANSDGHKGRPGASHPGATKFGAYGGLTCLLAPEFSRAGMMEALRKRHHYGTTGCRAILATGVSFDHPALLYSDDPNRGEVGSRAVDAAMMGDILQSREKAVDFSINICGSAPVERVDIRNGPETLEVYRPYEESDLGCRIRVLWEGSEYRGRGRETIWDGFAELAENVFSRVAPINRYNIDKKFELVSASRLEWSALTTGGFGGFDAWLDHPDSGTLSIRTELINEDIPINEIVRDEQIFENGGINRRIRVFRLPDINPHHQININRSIALSDDRDNALYVRVTQEDGHFIWSSPIYIFRSSDY